MTVALTAECPCGSGHSFESCCHLYLSGKRRAPNPESLMRSRYTAFVCVDVAYLERTMRGEAKQGTDREGTRAFASSVDWQGLEVLESKVSPSGKKGIVSFIASYQEGGEDKSIRERSLFRKHKGYWYYTGSAE